MYQDKRKEQADKMNYFDCHVDTLTEILKPGDTLDENSCNLDLKRVGNFVENYTQIFAIWKDAVKLDKEEPDRDFFRLYDRAMAYLAEEGAGRSPCPGRIADRRRNGKSTQAEKSSGIFIY